MNVYNGFISTDEDKLKLLRTFGATKYQEFTKVVLPSSIPTMINTLKINIGLSWVGVIVGEFLVSKAGIGYLIVYGGQVFNLTLVMMSVFILAIVAALMYQGVAIIEKRYFKSDHNFGRFCYISLYTLSNTLLSIFMLFHISSAFTA